jgi:hypothetical protein
MQQVATLKRARELGMDKSSIIRTLLYYDIFNYPLKRDEIASFFQVRDAPENSVTLLLDELVAEGLLVYDNGYYSVYKASEDVIGKRESGNRNAQFIMHKAYRYARLISWFPYVRCVCLSGSLSKGYMDESGDIDYFILTTPGRLWIARTLLIAYKKLFLLNSRKYFCVNYFIDTNNLEIPDKNVYTATELLTLVPVYNGALYSELVKHNTWASEYFPNHSPVEAGFGFRKRKFIVKGLIEGLLNNPVGSLIDSLFMKLTLKRWRAKFGYFPPDVFEQAMRTRKYVSKHHPQNFQQRVLQALDKRIQDFEAIHQVELNIKHG